MRQGEILGLKWNDVDLGTGIIYVRKAKSGKPREIPIHPELADILSHLPRNSDYVFSSHDGKPYSRYGLLRGGFERALKNAGIRDASFHTFRHTFASELAMKGVDLRTIQSYLGHSTIRMTERYAHLLPDHRKITIQLLGRKNCYHIATQESLPSQSSIEQL